MSVQPWEIPSVFPFPKQKSGEGEILRQLANHSERRLHWCSRCDAPLLTPQCYRCDSRGRRFIVDAKPVLDEERHLLEEMCGRELPESLYISRSRLYHKGRLLVSLAARDGRLEIVKDHTAKLLKDNPGRLDDTPAFQRAIDANAPVLGFLEQQAIDSIRESVRTYPDRRPVISFSGGKDSAVVAHLVARAIGASKPVSLFFADTTLEHPETSDYVREFAEHYGLPLSVERANCDFFQMCEQLEPPSRIMRWCCTVFKANPLNAYLRAQEKILSFDGIRRSESNRRRTYERVSGNKKALRQLVFRPILDWSSLAVWLYILAYKIPYNPAYNKGYARVGCVMCPFSTDFNDVLTRRNYPEKVQEWERMLTQYFVADYADKFDPKLAEEWLMRGLWKKRKPHHRNRNTVMRVQTCPSLGEQAYHMGFRMDARFLEYLKPFGRMTFVGDSGFFKVVNESRFCVSGTLGDDLLTVTFENPNTMQNLHLLERQLKKAMNCVQCGACVGVCPTQAIRVDPGVSFAVDEKKCTNCLSCVTSNFTHYGCVALSYKTERNWIEGPRLGNKESFQA